MAKTQFLVENFDGNGRNATLWNAVGTAFAQTDGTLVASSTVSSTQYAGYTSVTTYDLTGSYLGAGNGMSRSEVAN